MLLFFFRPHGSSSSGGGSAQVGITLQGIYVPSVTLQGVNT